MSQPKSLEQLHQECCEELRALDPSGGQRGPAVSRVGGAEWLQYLPIAGVVCSLSSTLISTLIAKHLFWDPQKGQLARLGADLDKALQEMKANRATAPSPETLQAIAALMPLLEQLLIELRGKVTPDELNGARNGVCTQLEVLGAPDAYAEEVAHIVTDKVGKPLLAPPGEGTPPTGPSRS